MWHRLGHWVVGAFVLLCGISAWSAPLNLRDGYRSVDAWTAVSVLSDPEKSLSIRDVLASEARFTPPAGAHGTLGIRPEAMWLRLPLSIAPDSDGRWILDVAYHPLNLVDVYLQDATGPRLVGRLGSLTPQADRPMKGLTHSLPLNLTPGQPHTLYLRVETQGSMILPISLNKPEAMVSRSGMEQMLQGLMVGLGLTLIAYSVILWRSLREPMFIQYVLMISGSLLFSLHFFGVGAAYLWPDVWWLEARITGISSLMATCGGFLFVSQILYGGGPSNWGRKGNRRARRPVRPVRSATPSRGPPPPTGRKREGRRRTGIPCRRRTKRSRSTGMATGPAPPRLRPRC
jgi:hypothetical protein